jgi:hypothetical protein
MTRRSENARRRFSQAAELRLTDTDQEKRTLVAASPKLLGFSCRTAALERASGASYTPPAVRRTHDATDGATA